MKQPEISVIMPVYNAQEYLEEALNSLTAQRFDSFEVIIVNDGSTDVSGEIAQARARSDRRLRYFETENAGPGAARNFAMRHALGRYVAFCDADDTIPEFAYKHMHALAEKHGCDIVIGSAGRFDSEGRRPSRLHRKALAGLDELVHITTHPQLIYDTTACKNLYSHAFLDRIGFQFPEGMIFEDMPAMIELQYRAKTCAFLDEVVYMWRMRDRVSKSLTQDKTTAGAFEDRLRAMRMTDAFFEQNVTERALFEAKDRKWLRNDLMIYLNALPAMEDLGRREQMRRAMLGFLDGIDAAAFDSITAIERIKYHYLQQGDYDGLGNAVEFSKTRYDECGATLRDDGEYYGSFGFADAPDSLSKMTYEIVHQNLQTTVTGVSFDDEGLRVQAVARLRGVRTSADDRFDVRLTLHPTLGDARPPAAEAHGMMELRPAKPEGGMPHYDYRFEALFPTRDLDAIPDGTYKVMIEASYNGLELDPKPLKKPEKGRKARPFPRIAGGRIATVLYNSSREAKVTVNTMESPVLKGISDHADFLEAEDAEGARHAIDHLDIDLDHHRIGDPMERPYYFLDRAPLLCPYEGGFLCMSRISSGQPHVSLIEKGAMIIDAQLDDGKLSLIVQLTESLADSGQPQFALIAEQREGESGDGARLDLKTRVIPFDGLHLVEIDFGHYLMKPPKAGTYALVLLGDGGEELPVLRNAAHCQRTVRTVNRLAFTFQIEIVTASGCKISVQPKRKHKRESR